MSQEHSTKVEQEKNLNESENITNDASFNIRFQPHEISTVENKTTGSNFKDKLHQTSNTISNSMDFSM
jgi:hypothetical protein